MWSDDDGPYEGKHYQLGRTLNSPQPLRRPHPPILIGGGGEKKTLRLVAQYAQACNLFAGAESSTSSTCCASTARTSAATTTRSRRRSWSRSTRAPTARRSTPCSSNLQRLAGLGVSEAHGWVPAVETITPLEVLGEKVIPEAAKL